MALQHVLPTSEKFTKYCLNPDRDLDKATAFGLALGYGLSNAGGLIAEIKRRLPYFRAKKKENKGFGPRYEVIMCLKGPNGKCAKVLTSWIDDESNGEMRLTSAYVDS